MTTQREERLDEAFWDAAKDFTTRDGSLRLPKNREEAKRAIESLRDAERIVAELKSPGLYDSFTTQDITAFLYRASSAFPGLFPTGASREWPGDVLSSIRIALEELWMNDTEDESVVLDAQDEVFYGRR